MSTGQTFHKESASLEETLAWARQIGSRLKGGEVIELVSDLGGGKTAFVRGLVDGMGSTDQVSSPSFTLSNEYEAGELRLRHYDFYRLSEPGIMRDEIAEAIADSSTVVAVEWADVISEVLPRERITIVIEVTAETARKYVVTYPDSMSYLMAGL